MPNRYKFTKVMKNKKGQRVYRPTLYPTIPLDDNDIFLWTKEGDRLDNLAFKYYKDITLWWIISKANDNISYGRVALEAGIQIRIPMNIEKALKDLELLNNK
jgi:phage tail protein X